MLWIVEYTDDVDADFRVFYRFPSTPDGPGIAQGNFGNFSGPQLLKLCWRLFTYQGACANRASREEQKRQESSPARRNHNQYNKYSKYNPNLRGPGVTERREVTFEQAMADNSDMVEYETV